MAPDTRTNRGLRAPSLGLLRWVALAAIALAAGIGATQAAAAKGAKLSPRLQLLAGPALVNASPAVQARSLGLPAAGAGSLMRSGARVVVYVRLSSVGPGARAAASGAGLRITHVAEPYRTVTGAIEPRRLRALATLSVVLGVTEALQPRLGVAPPPSVAP